MDGILEFIATVILNFLWNKAATSAATLEAQVNLDKERKETNDANIKAYAVAVDRAARRKAALDLLNRVQHLP